MEKALFRSRSGQSFKLLLQLPNVVHGQAKQYTAALCRLLHCCGRLKLTIRSSYIAYLHNLDHLSSDGKQEMKLLSLYQQGDIFRLLHEHSRKSALNVFFPSMHGENATKVDVNSQQTGKLF
ncbi:DNA-directed RNA polymerase subunit alpha [Trichinella pseudospiralis]